MLTADKLEQLAALGREVTRGGPSPYHPHVTACRGDGSCAAGGWTGAPDVWRVLDEAQRPAWTFTPFESVGPLEFGMTHAQVQTAADGIFEVGVWQGDADCVLWAEFRHVQPPTGIFGPAVTVYDDRSVGLAGIAVNALRGPQVTLEGIRLVGQTPSRSSPSTAWRDNAENAH